MKFQVVFLSSAEHDLKALRSYMVKNFGQDTWQASYSKIKETVNTIRAFPLQGGIPGEIQHFNLTQYHQMISGMNRIIYEIRQETIFIHIICDTRKDMRSLLMSRLLSAI